MPSPETYLKVCVPASLTMYAAGHGDRIIEKQAALETDAGQTWLPSSYMMYASTRGHCVIAKSYAQRGPQWLE